MHIVQSNIYNVFASISNREDKKGTGKYITLLYRRNFIYLQFSFTNGYERKIWMQMNMTDYPIYTSIDTN